jgi:predicted oxidoreductase
MKRPALIVIGISLGAIALASGVVLLGWLVVGGPYLLMGDLACGAIAAALVVPAYEPDERSLGRFAVWAVAGLLLVDSPGHLPRWPRRQARRTTRDP